MRVIVCGGRDFTDVDALHKALDNYHHDHIITMLMEGDARGADRFAGLWAELNKIPHKKFPAQWRRYGDGAGPIRNAQMLREGKPDVVIFAPGGAGTRNMVEQAIIAGVQVIRMESLL